MTKIIIVIVLMMVPLTVNAGILSASCIEDGSCDLDEGFQVFVDLAQWGLGILGSMALLFFIYGGLIWLTSGGNTTKIDKGRKVMINTLIGIIIVFTAYLSVNFILGGLGKGRYESLNKISASQQGSTDECVNKNENDYCKNDIGICKDTECVDRCGQDPKEPETIGMQCRDRSECAVDNNDDPVLVSGLCFGSYNRVCCFPK